MQVSVEITPEVSQYIKTSESTQEKPACEILAEKLRAEYEDEQKAIKALDDFLEPAIIAAKNGDVVNQTFDEIVKEARNKIAEESQ